MRSHLRRVLAAATITLAALIAPVAGTGLAATAGGAPAVLKERKAFTGFYYGDFDKEILLLAGEPFNSNYCDEVNSPKVTKFYRQRRNGTWVERWRAVQRVSLYRTPLGGPEYDEQQCAAIADGAEPPEPFATGWAFVRSYQNRLASPDGPPKAGSRIVNRSFGFVSDSGGRQYVVRAKADLVLDADLIPLSSPTEFQSLRLRRLGGRWR